MRSSLAVRLKKGTYPMEVSISRPRMLAALGVGLTMANGCGRTDLSDLAGSSEIGVIAGSTGSGGSDATGGAGGAVLAGSAGGMVSTGGSSALGVGGAIPTGGHAGTGGSSAQGTGGAVPTGGGSQQATGGAGGGSEACAGAPCLESLFQTCVPEGSCSVQGGSSPSAAYSTACYSNGVTVSHFGTYSFVDYKVVSQLTVRRNDAACFIVETAQRSLGDPVTYVISDASGQPVAVATVGDDPAHVTVTCNGGESTSVSVDCLSPASDTSACVSGPCP